MVWTTLKHFTVLSNYHKQSLSPTEINFDKIDKLKRDSLKEILSLFKEYEVPYWLDYGTLLGIYRDDNLLPWDSDIDISIFQSDFNIKSNLWKDICGRGFTINFGTINSYNLKINKEMGDLFFKIDLRIYIVKNNDAFYFRGRLPKSKSGKMFIRFYNSIFSKKIDYYSAVCDYIKDSSDYPNTYDFKGSKFLIREDGTFVTDRGKVVSKENFLGRKKSFVNSLITAQTRQKLHEYCLIFKSKIEFKSYKKIKIPHLIIKEFTHHSFDNFEFIIPREVEGYLSHIFGINWKKKDLKWRH